jgi:acetyl esterase/lipase
VPALLVNCGRLAYGVINVPAYVGSYERRADIRYGDLPRQSLDVYVPAGAWNRPTVVFWYGGMWTKGSKEQYRFVGAALANAGYVAILPDYRLYPSVRFPDFVDDGALALKWAREHAAELGGDPRSIFIMGHSAGAHLAALLALDERYLRNVGGDASWIRGDRDLRAIRADDARSGVDRHLRRACVLGLAAHSAHLASRAAGAARARLGGQHGSSAGGCGLRREAARARHSS